MAVDPSFVQFQQNMRTTAVGVNFGRRLFTDPDSLDAKQITEVMKALGLKIPPEVQMSIEAAQAISTGSALIENYQTAQDVQSLTSATAATIRIANAIGNHNGWIDDDTSSAIRIGTSVAMIYASGGMDVSSWIALASEFYTLDAKLSVQAQMMAQKGAIDYYKNMISFQAGELAASTQRLITGEINVFGYLVEAADYSPALFKNVIVENPNFKFIRDMFPNIVFIPTVTETITTNVSATDWTTNTQSARFDFSFQTLKNMKREEALTTIFELLIDPVAKEFLAAEEELEKYGRMSLMDFLVISCLDMKSFFINNNAYFLTQLVKNRLTLYDLGYGVVYGGSLITKDVALNFDGKIKTSNRLTPEQLKLAERTGRIEIVAKDPDARSRMERFLTIGDIPMSPNVLDGRNYMAVLDFMHMVMNSGIQGLDTNPTIYRYSKLGTLEKFSQKMKDAQSLSTLRKVNTMALANVAYFLGGKNGAQVRNVSGLREGKGSVFRKVE